MTAHRRYLFVGLVLCGIASSQLIELFVNRILRPDAEEITWISEAVLAGGFVVVTWLWFRLRETQIALTHLERQQIVAETQLTIAARVQTSLLPALPGPSAGVSWYAAVEPAGKIGGDYYDFLPLPDGRMCVALADVSGKGVAAAVFVANVRATLRALARDATHPRTLLSRLSSALLADSTSGLYVTCIVAIVDPKARSMVYVNAGHPAGVLWNPTRARGLRVGGPPAGLLADASFEEEVLAFGDGDLVVFVSDGITEALDASGDAAVNAIAAQIEQAEKLTPEAVCARLLAAGKAGSGPHGVDGWMDDRTAVVFGVIA
jgi:sigma-B regulation protein RsbU (phosphoserine phosphatase)